MAIITISAPSGSDDTSAIAAKFATASAGDTIVFPAGATYLISNDFELILDNLTILGNGCKIIQTLNSYSGGVVYGFLRIKGNGCVIDGFRVTGQTTTTRVAANGTFLGYDKANRACAVYLIGSNCIVSNITVEYMFTGVMLRGPITTATNSNPEWPDGTVEQQRRYDYTLLATGNRLVNLTTTKCDFTVTGSQQDTLLIDGLTFHDGTQTKEPPHAIYIFRQIGVPVTANVRNVGAIVNSVITNVTVDNASFDEAIKINGAQGLTLSNITVTNSNGGITIANSKQVVLTRATLTDLYGTKTNNGSLPVLQRNGAGYGLWFETSEDVRVEDVYILTGSRSGYYDSFGLRSRGASKKIRLENVTIKTNYATATNANPFRLTGSVGLGTSELEMINCTHIVGNASSYTFRTDPDVAALGLEFPAVSDNKTSGDALPIAYESAPVAVKPLVSVTDYTYSSSTGMVQFKNSGALALNDIVVFIWQDGTGATFTKELTAAAWLTDYLLAASALNAWAYRKNATRQPPNQVRNLTAVSAVRSPRLSGSTDYDFDAANGKVKFKSGGSGSLAVNDVVSFHWVDKGMVCKDEITVPDFTNYYYLAPPIPSTATLYAYKNGNTQAMVEKATNPSNYDYEINAAAGTIRFWTQNTGTTLNTDDKVIVSFTSSDAISSAKIVNPAIRGTRSHDAFYNYAGGNIMSVSLDPLRIEGFQGTADFTEGSPISKTSVPATASGLITTGLTLEGSTTAGTPTYVSRFATFSRSDRLISVSGTVSWSAKTSMAGSLVYLKGLPPRANDLADDDVFIDIYNCTLATLTAGQKWVLNWQNDQVGPSLAKINADGTITNLTVTDLPTTGNFSFHGAYQTDAVFYPLA